jgi:predicted ATP-dependent serine protease
MKRIMIVALVLVVVLAHRPVPQCARRVKEFMLAGFNTVLLSSSDAKEARETGFKGIEGLTNISKAIDFLF